MYIACFVLMLVINDVYMCNFKSVYLIDILSLMNDYIRLNDWNIKNNIKYLGVVNLYNILLKIQCQ